MQVHPTVQQYLPSLVRYVRQLTEEYKVALARIQAECAANIYRIHCHDAEWQAQTTFLDSLRTVLSCWEHRDANPSSDAPELPFNAVQSVLVEFSSQSSLAKPVNYPCKSDMLLTYFQFLTALQAFVKILTESKESQSSLESWAGIRGLIGNAAGMLKSNQGVQLKSAVPEQIVIQLSRACYQR